MLIVLKVEINIHLFHFLLLFQENMHYDFISYTHQKRELPLFWINRFIHLFQQSRLGHLLALLVNLQGGILR